MKRALAPSLIVVLWLISLPVLAAQYKKMEGRWYNNDTRKEVTIEADGDNTRVTFGQSGTGLVYPGSSGGANISVEGPNFKCSYFMSFLNQGARMTLNRISGSPSVCFDGIFERVDREGSNSNIDPADSHKTITSDRVIRSLAEPGKVKIINDCQVGFRIYVIYTMQSGGRSKPIVADVPAGANGFLSDAEGSAFLATNGVFEIFGISSNGHREIRGYDTVGDRYYKLPSGKEEGFKKIFIDISQNGSYDLPVCKYSALSSGH